MGAMRQTIRLLLLLLLLVWPTGCGATPTYVNASYPGRGDAGPVLVAYASYAGSTAEVADAMARALSGKGLAAEVRPVGSVDNPSRYSAVVLGSAIRMGKLHADVVDFVKKHKAALDDKHVAYFVVCMTMKDDTPENRREATAWLAPIESEVRPVEVGLFAGKLAREPLSWFDSLVTRFAGGTEGDYRDWNAIRVWSEQLAERLRAKR